MKLLVRVPGSCGELVQGYAGGQPFLVTCPIDCYARACITEGKTDFNLLGEKSRRALQGVLAYMGEQSFPYELTLQSDIPVGKGMASSSADIGATIVAAAAAFGKTLTEQEVAYLAAAVEPTDGVFCRGVVAINYKTGAILRSYGTLPPLRIIMFDLGGTVDTEAYHARFDEKAACYCSASARALPLLERPYEPVRIGEAATLSAKAHQEILYKPQLDAFIDAGRAYGAVGVVVGHSGTVCGVLFSPQQAAVQLDAAAKSLEVSLGVPCLGIATLCGGGWDIEEM